MSRLCLRLRTITIGRIRLNRIPNRPKSTRKRHIKPKRKIDRYLSKARRVVRRRTKSDEIKTVIKKRLSLLGRDYVDIKDQIGSMVDKESTSNQRSPFFQSGNLINLKIPKTYLYWNGKREELRKVRKDRYVLRHEFLSLSPMTDFAWIALWFMLIPVSGGWTLIFFAWELRRFYVNHFCRIERYYAPIRIMDQKILKIKTELIQKGQQFA